MRYRKTFFVDFRTSFQPAFSATSSLPFLLLSQTLFFACILALSYHFISMPVCNLQPQLVDDCISKNHAHSTLKASSIYRLIQFAGKLNLRIWNIQYLYDVDFFLKLETFYRNSDAWAALCNKKTVADSLCNFFKFPC